MSLVVISRYVDTWGVTPTSSKSIKTLHAGTMPTPTPLTPFSRSGQTPCMLRLDPRDMITGIYKRKMNQNCIE